MASADYTARVHPAVIQASLALGRSGLRVTSIFRADSVDHARGHSLDVTTVGMRVNQFDTRSARQLAAFLTRESPPPRGYHWEAVSEDNHVHITLREGSRPPRAGLYTTRGVRWEDAAPEAGDTKMHDNNDPYSGLILRGPSGVEMGDAAMEELVEAFQEAGSPVDFEDGDPDEVEEFEEIDETGAPRRRRLLRRTRITGKRVSGKPGLAMAGPRLGPKAAAFVKAARAANAPIDLYYFRVKGGKPIGSSLGTPNAGGLYMTLRPQEIRALPAVMLQGVAVDPNRVVSFSISGSNLDLDLPDDGFPVSTPWVHMGGLVNITVTNFNNEDGLKFSLGVYTPPAAASPDMAVVIEKDAGKGPCEVRYLRGQYVGGIIQFDPRYYTTDAATPFTRVSRVRISGLNVSNYSAQFQYLLRGNAEVDSWLQQIR